MTKSARARFSASGSWWARMRSELFRRSCRAARARAARCTSASARDDGDLVDRLAPAAFSNSRGMSSTTSGASAMRGEEAPRARARTAGWISASSRASASRLAEHRARPALSRSTPAGPVVPGKCASISRDQRALRPLQPVHHRVGIEHRHALRPRTSAATVDLPMPIEPVRPRTTVMTSAAPAVRRRARAAAASPKNSSKAHRRPGRSASSGRRSSEAPRPRAARASGVSSGSIDHVETTRGRLRRAPPRSKAAAAAARPCRAGWR